MVTLLLIACNQEGLLKDHLSTYKCLMDSIQGNIILVDDGSSDHTKEYVTTHFEMISYMKNPVELGYCQSFNKVLPYIKTPYVLCIDLTIDIRFIPLKKALAYAKKNKIFMTSFPFLHHNKQFYGYYLVYKQFKLHFQETSLKQPCFCSELMLLDTKRLQKLGGFSLHYHSTAFSWHDLIYRAIKEGDAVTIRDNSVCYKQSSLSTFFSYLSDQKALFKDNFLFQWRFYRSFTFILKRTLSIMFIFLSFNGSNILHFLQAYFQWLFFTQRYPCYPTNSTASRLQRLFPNVFSPSQVFKDPILFTKNSHWNSSILTCSFSFKSLMDNRSAHVFIDINSISQFTYYVLYCINIVLKLLFLNKQFYFVSSNYSLEHEIAHRLV
ncbi:hypothetical protein CL658_01290 [bacterium]|nr:hypothetical protein [bacterium]